MHYAKATITTKEVTMAKGVKLKSQKRAVWERDKFWQFEEDNSPFDRKRFSKSVVPSASAPFDPEPPIRSTRLQHAW